jgi:hypothetical protein
VEATSVRLFGALAGTASTKTPEELVADERDDAAAMTPVAFPESPTRSVPSQVEEGYESV